mmetsp:Transcript_107440/g.342464  ORF Transcript_107440/g.342464 Transcript_107440/m.342464 type:complete len:330 (+) Transcript_107440:54-1043(+)
MGAPARRGEMGRATRGKRRSCLGAAALGLCASMLVALLASEVPAFGLRPGAARSRRHERTVARHAQVLEPYVLEPYAGTSAALIKSQNSAGREMVELGRKLQAAEFEAQALGGSVKVVFDGHQDLRTVAVEGVGALVAAGGDRGALAQAVLGALQEAFDKSAASSREDVWKLHSTRPDLLQAPLVQIGAGRTTVDLWENVTSNAETIKLAEELFLKFDEDVDGYWNLKETSTVQLATEGTDMAEDSFNALIIAAAPQGGRTLTEEDLAKGLSKQQVVELYTDAKRQRQLGFVLDIRKDHAKVFNTAPAEPAAAEAAEEGGSGAGPPELD